MVTKSESLDHADPLAALYGRGLISTAQYHAGRDIADLIAIVARAKVGSVWMRILSGASGGILSFDPSPQVERAQRTLAKIKAVIEQGNPLWAKPVLSTCAGSWVAVFGILKGPNPDQHPVLGHIQAGLEQVSIRWAA